jgi:tRNA1(Val) A37 N6-methylase TrmN6
MTAGGLDTWIRFLAACAAPGGRFWMIHRADALAQVLAALNGRFGGAQVFPLFPRAGAPARRIIVSALKGSRAGLTLLPGLVMHNSDGSYTATAEAVLRHGAALPLDRTVPASDAL